MQQCGLVVSCQLARGLGLGGAAGAGRQTGASARMPCPWRVMYGTLIALRLCDGDIGTTLDLDKRDTNGAALTAQKAEWGASPPRPETPTPPSLSSDP